ncbi:MAG TPA: hypothetical protein VIY48_16865 [Candidatus Paceibacterota bacterium]
MTRAEAKRYWVWDYELKDLGSYPWPESPYKGHNKPKEIVLGKDHEAALQAARAEALEEAAQVVVKLTMSKRVAQAIRQLKEN